MKKLLKKISLLFLSFLILISSYLTILAPSVHAQSTWYNQNPIEWFIKVYDPNNPSEIFGERYTAAQVQWIIYSLLSFFVPDKPLVQCMLSGDLTSCLTQVLTALGISDASNNPNYIPLEEKGLSSLVFESDRPISFISYTKHLSQKFSPVSLVHAQTSGFGYNALSVIQTLWTASRNIVYGLFVIITVVLAFMVMFRVKISPQVAISAQSAIPKIIVAVILVTFSYAIAGLLIDLMYVVVGILSLALSTVGHEVFATDPVTIYKFLTTGYIGLNSSLGASVGIFGLFFLYILLFSIMVFAALFVINGGIIGTIVTLGLLPFIAALIGLVVFVLMLIVIIFLGLKTILMLIKAFAQILLLTIVAPFQIAFGVIIQGSGFGSWLKAFAANLAVFPVTGLLMALSFLFLMLAGNVLGGAIAQFNPWQLLAIFGPGGLTIGNAIAANTGWPPLLGGSNAMLGLIFVGVSFTIFTMIPKTAEIVKGFISGKPSYGTAIGEVMGIVRGGGSAAAGYVGTKYEAIAKSGIGSAASRKSAASKAGVAEAIRTLLNIR